MPFFECSNAPSRLLSHYLEASKLHRVLAKLEFFSVEHDSIFCTMKEKIEGVKECPFDVRVIE